VPSQKNTPVKNVVQEQLTLEPSPSGEGREREKATNFKELPPKKNGFTINPKADG